MANRKESGKKEKKLGGESRIAGTKQRKGWGKRWLISLCLLVLLLGVCGFSGADQYIFDQAGILTEQEETQLETECRALSEKIQADVWIVTSQERADDSKKEAKEWILEQNRGYGEGKESILFLINMEERVFTVYEYNTEASGYLLTDDEIDEIIAAVKKDMSAGNYLEACETYLDRTEYYSQVDYGENHPEKGEFLDSVWIRLLISMGVAAVVIGILVVTRNKDAKPAGAVYLKEGSRRIHRREDFFTHTTVVKRKIETSSSSHGGSSGGNHGGGHGGSSSF